MKLETVILNPLNIDLDFSNPRFSMFDFKSEEEIIKYLLDFEQIKELAFQIAENGYNTLGERVIVLKNEQGHYTVLEGNRRIASLKLLFQYQFLLKSSERKKIERLNLRIENFEVSCDIVTESTRDDALFKISAKHVDGIKTWSATDKRVFYHNLYNQYRNKGLTRDESLDKIKVITPEGKVAIRNAIQQLNYLISVHNATLTYQSNLEKLTDLDTDVLVSRVLRPLVKELELEFNDEFQTISKNDKVYHEILGLLGKAVWIDKQLDTRTFAKQEQWKEIIEKIPNLAEKIKEYKEFEKITASDEGSFSNSLNNDVKTSEDCGQGNEEPSNSSVNDTYDNITDNNDTQSQEPKYKFFVPKEQVVISTPNYDLINCIDLIDNENNKVPRESSEYKRVVIRCESRNIVIDNNVVNQRSDNGRYTINAEYDAERKSFPILLNIEVATVHQDYQVLFNTQWYIEALAKISAKHEYFKICEVIRKLQNYNVLSGDVGNHIIIAFLLRNLIEYSTKAYADLVGLQQSQENLPSLVSSVKNHLVTKNKLSKTESKALNKHEIDIETLNGMLHDYKTEISTVSIQSIGRKFSRYFSVIFDKLSEGGNNG